MKTFFRKVGMRGNRGRRDFRKTEKGMLSLLANSCGLVTVTRRVHQLSALCAGDESKGFGISPAA